jgi:hypothetical protein
MDEFLQKRKSLYMRCELGRDGEASNPPPEFMV